MQISETTLLKKLQLSKQFSRKRLCARKSELGVGMLKPTIMIMILALKLCLGHERNNNRISNMIAINEKNLTCQHGYNQSMLNIERLTKPKNITWSDEIRHALESREIIIENGDGSWSYKI